MDTKPKNTVFSAMKDFGSLAHPKPFFLHCSSTPSLLNHWTYTGVTLDLHWSSTALTLTPLCPSTNNQALQRYSGIPDP
ncbi:MAG: hypothetical protein SO188_00810 [Prevotella sp.]|nr:hypothetical protein [Prevotella sp.]